jgi:hypothetical protein
MLNLAVHVLTTYHINFLLKKIGRNKKYIGECLERSLLSLHEIQNRTANKFLFTQSSELFSFFCSIWHTSVFKFTTLVYWTVSEWCECIAMSESDGAFF